MFRFKMWLLEGLKNGIFHTRKLQILLIKKKTSKFRFLHQNSSPDQKYLCILFFYLKKAQRWSLVPGYKIWKKSYAFIYLQQTIFFEQK